MQITFTILTITHNAISDVKDIADSVTLSNDEDGVAEWLAKNVLMGMEQ